MIKISLDDFNKNFESKSSSINKNTANYIIKKRNEDYKNKKTNYWIHGIPFEHLKEVDKGLNFNKDMETKRYLGVESKNSKLMFKSKDSNEMKEISPNDKIIIFTTFEKKIHNFEKGINFIAYTEVDNVISIDEELYGGLESKIKLELKGMKYFRKPVLAKDLINELDFIENKDKNYKYSKIEFKDISEDDFKVIFDCGGGLSKYYPLFFQNIPPLTSDFQNIPPLTLDFFIEKTIKSVNEIIAKTKKGKVFEITKILKDTLDNYDIKKSEKKLLSYEELLDFHNSIESNFEHLPIREAKKPVSLYTNSGKDKKTNYWIHKIPLKLLNLVDKGLKFDKDKKAKRKRYLGVESKNSKLMFKSKDSNKMQKISPNDKIIIFTTFEKKIHNFEKGIYFIAYTEVNDRIKNDEELYGVFESEIKLELKKLEYFRKPVLAKDLVNELDFIENKDEKYNYSSIEFKDIGEDDFKVIFDCGGGLSEKIPLFFQNIPPLTLDLFIEKTIKFVYEIIAKTEKGKVFEIKKFIKILKDILDNYDIKKSDKKSLSYEELLDFYAHNAIKFKFGHLPIREADKSVFLYTSSGKKQKFGYIVLNKQ